MARVSAGRQTTGVTKRTSLHRFNIFHGLRFIRAVSDGFPITAVEAFQLPGIDDQFIGFKMVVFAMQVTRGAGGIVGTCLLRGFSRAHSVFLLR